jgi:hypothetical protein
MCHPVESEQPEEKDMRIELNREQTYELMERSSDVAQLARMMSTGSRHVTMEMAYLAWRMNSDSSAAGWLSFDESSKDEVSGAFTSLAIDRIRSETKEHFAGLQDQVVDYARELLDKALLHPGDEMLIVKTADAGTVLGRMGRSSYVDYRFVEDICQNFDYGLSEHAVMFERRIVLEEMGLRIVDTVGNDN